MPRAVLPRTVDAFAVGSRTIFILLGLEPDLNVPESADVKPAALGGNVRYMPERAMRGVSMDEAEQSARRRRARRANFIKWLRKVHGWVGLWGAALGLMFGVTGFLLNHRMGPLKVSSGEPQVEEVLLPLPQKTWSSPDEMARWLKGELQLDGRVGRARREPAHPVAWGDRKAMQPEFWQVGIVGPTQTVQADYWLGNGFVAVKRTHHSFFTTLNNLHRGVGLSVGWVLLIDTIAGGLVVLSLTGVLLWTEMNKRRLMGVGVVVGSVLVAVVFGVI